MSFKIDRRNRVCVRCERNFDEGDRHMSAIRQSTEEDDIFLREDVCLECWSEDPATYYSFWQVYIPFKEEERNATDIEAVQMFFQRLVADNEKSDYREQLLYLLGLMLIRKRRLKVRDDKSLKGGPITCEASWDGASIDVPTCDINEEQMEAVKQTLAELFGWNQEPEATEDGEENGAESEPAGTTA